MQIYDFQTTAANNNTPAPNGFPENMPYGDVNDAARELMAALARWRDAAFATTITTGGTSTAYTLTSGQSLTAYANGQRISFTAHAASGATPTMNVDSIGARNLVNTAGTQLGANSLRSGGRYLAVVRSTDIMVLNAENIAAVNGPASSTDNNVPRFDGTAGNTLQASPLTVTDNGDATLTGSAAGLTVTNTDAGATRAPIFNLLRASASPADNDALGSVDFSGYDSGGNEVRYAALEAVLLDEANSSEDGELRLIARIADSPTQVAAIHDGMKVGSPTGGYKGAGTLNAASGVYDNNVRLGIQSSAPQTTTGAASFDFTSIPAGVKRITVNFEFVSFSGSDDLLVQLGDSGGVETTGYASGAIDSGGAVGSSAGFIAQFGAAGRIFSGAMTITRLTGNNWVATHIFYDEIGGNSSWGAGRKALSAELDRVRIVSSGGGNFDAGQVSILYE